MGANRATLSRCRAKTRKLWPASIAACPTFGQFQGQSREQLQRLAAPPESYQAKEELELLVGIGQIFWRLRSCRSQPVLSAGDLASSNLKIRLSQFDLASHGKDLKAMDSALAEVDGSRNERNQTES